jgi:hypothetical protein
MGLTGYKLSMKKQCAGRNFRALRRRGHQVDFFLHHAGWFERLN